MPHDRRDRREFTAGPLRALLDGPDLRYLRVGDAEVVRRIYVGVRDASWGTVEPSVREVRAEQKGPDAFDITFFARHTRDPVDFEWRGHIRAQARRADAGQWTIAVTYEMNGYAHRSFDTCRTGLCVLHPLIGVAGMPCTVEHPTGERQDGRFPGFEIDPQPPFTDICAIEHFNGGEVRIEFAGEIFEMEDQRNWADGSFKTYCRPLSRPFPYRLEATDRITHLVTVQIRVHEESIHSDAAPWLGLEETELGPFPGIGLSWGGGRISESELARARALGLAHLHVDLRVSRDDWLDELTVASDAARRLELPLEVALHANPDDVERSARSVAAEVTRLGAPVRRWFIYEAGRQMASEQGVAVAKRVLAAVTPDAPVGGGTIGNFTELNRNRPATGSMDLLAYPINPQVHATDDLSIIENLEAIGATAVAAQFIAGRPGPTQLAVSPVALARKPDPFAKGKDGSTIEPAVADPRQITAFGAAWTLAALKQLAEAGVNSVTLFDLSGAAGVMQGRCVYPPYDVLAELADFASGNVLLSTQADPLRHAGLAIRSGNRLRLLVASLHWEPTRVELRALPRFRRAGFSPLIAGLDGRPGELIEERADGRPELVLPPYAVVRVDYLDTGDPEDA